MTQWNKKKTTINVQKPLKCKIAPILLCYLLFKAVILVLLASSGLFEYAQPTLVAL